MRLIGGSHADGNGKPPRGRGGPILNWQVLCWAAMFSPRRIRCTLAMLVVMASAVVAQTNATTWNTVKALTAGTDVRITTGSRTVRGKLDRVTDDTLVVTSGKGQEMFTQQ